MDKFEVENEISNQKELLRVNENNIKNSKDEKVVSMSEHFMEKDKALLSKLEEEDKSFQ